VQTIIKAVFGSARSSGSVSRTSVVDHSVVDRANARRVTSPIASAAAKSRGKGPQRHGTGLRGTKGALNRDEQRTAGVVQPLTAGLSLQTRNSKLYDVCIIGGCGHVGLPLGLALADRGQRVVLYDINEATVDKVNHKIMPFLEEGAPEILTRAVDARRLVATTDITVISKAHVLVLVIGTPVDGHLNPRLHDVMDTIKKMIPHMDDTQLLVLRSTLYPGVTEKIRDYLRSRGKGNDVVFCPERTAEGREQECLTFTESK